MAPAASATTAGQSRPSGGRRRRPHGAIPRRFLLQLLAGVLFVGLIPVLATVHILDANALQNERARADTALRAQLQGASQELAQLADDASNRADDLARSPRLQRAFIAGDRATIRRIAAGTPGVLFYLHRDLVAGQRSPDALSRSISLTVNGNRIGTVVGTISLNAGLAKRLHGAAVHGRNDRLLIVRQQSVVGRGVVSRSTVAPSPSPASGIVVCSHASPTPSGSASLRSGPSKRSTRAFIPTSSACSTPP
jgi:hypothetical protein